MKITLVKILNAEQQVVAGMNFLMTLKVHLLLGNPSEKDGRLCGLVLEERILSGAEHTRPTN